MGLVYHEIPPIDREKAKRDLAEGDEEAVCMALLALALHDEDYQWVQEECLRFAHSDSRAIQKIVVLCFGHLARIHGRLDLDRVRSALVKLRGDPEVAGLVDDIVEDIKIFADRGFSLNQRVRKRR